MFDPLKRLRAGLYRFGKLEVEFLLRGHDLVARLPNCDGGPPQESTAVAFFTKHGQTEFPSACSTAVQLSAQSPNSIMSTAIEPQQLALAGGDAQSSAIADLDAQLTQVLAGGPPLAASPVAQSYGAQSAGAPMTPATGYLPHVGPPAGVRYQPYAAAIPGAFNGGLAPGTLVQTGGFQSQAAVASAGKFGLDDDEI